MHPNFSDLYALELKLEHEKGLLNLTEEERLIRKAKTVKISGRVSLPRIKLQELLQVFGRRDIQQYRADNIALRTKVHCCSPC